MRLYQLALLFSPKQNRMRARRMHKAVARAFFWVFILELLHRQSDAVEHARACAMESRGDASNVSQRRR
jgi:hypothetical protein